jgi:glycosyltransferase involved in cell wall biosynthesis
MLKKILVIGQIPPPFGGQALMLQTLLDLEFDKVKLFHLDMRFSKDFDHMGSFKLYKFWILVKTIILAWFYKFYYKIDILYYGPSGPNKFAVFRDILLLFPIRFLFNKTLFHSHAGGTSQVYSDLPFFLKFFYRVSFFKPEGLIKLTNYSHGDEELLCPKKCFIVPNGIEDYYNVNNFKRKNNSKVNILYVGAMYPERGITELIEACKILNEENIDFHLNLMGMFFSKLYENYILECINKFNLNDKISFLGTKTGVKKWEIYNNNDILCFPSYVPSESFGLVVVEAMQFETPVVATNWNGIANIIDDNINGILCNPKDASSLASNLKTLIFDENLRLSMGKKGRQTFLKHFTIKQFNINLQQVFNEL